MKTILKILAVSASVAALVPAPSVAQIAEKVDPTTGNYVPLRDPFLKSDPDPDAVNPNRLGNRQSQRNARTTAPASSAKPANPDDGLTPAQRVAAGAANNGRAAPVITAPNGQDEQTTADGFVSMGGMAIYSPPGSATPSDAFAKPDWWPR